MNEFMIEVRSEILTGVFGECPLSVYSNEGAKRRAFITFLSLSNAHEMTNFFICP